VRAAIPGKGTGPSTYACLLTGLSAVIATAVFGAGGIIVDHYTPLPAKSSPATGPSTPPAGPGKPESTAVPKKDASSAPQEQRGRGR
jgi:hypothetical protein